MVGYAFNSPPGWPTPPDGWTPPEGWTPDPGWPPAPADWVFWIAALNPLPASPPAATTPPVSSPVEPDAATSVGPQIAPAPTPVPPADPTPLLDAMADPVPPASEDTTVGELRKQLQAARAELAMLHDAAASGELVELDDDRVLQEVGIYRYHHPLENAAAYRERLDRIQEQIKDLIKQREAILASEMFTYNNSLARGRKMTSDFSMLRAYNAEADSCVRSLRAGNVVTAKKRLEASVTSIVKLGSMMEMRVNPDYHALRIDELELTADFLMKQQEEREAARDERDRLREQRKVEQELAAQREDLDKQRAHYANAIQALQASGDEAGAAELTAKLATVDHAIAQNDYRAANIRAGYVYVISNVGAFGPGVVKIGMTRRLEPMDRVRELGDASVPFPFDVHAMYFSDDAVSLETELHHVFVDRKLNHINERREFFFATPEEVRIVLAEKVGNLLEYTEHPEAMQYQQSKGYWPDTGAT